MLSSLFSGSMVGVDLGASSIKVIQGQFQKKKGVFEVESMELHAIPRGIMSDRGIQSFNEVSHELSAVMSSLSKKNLKVATAVKGSGVFTKRILMPKVPEKEIPQQVRWEAEQVFPTDISSILITYQLIGEGMNVPLAPPGTPGWDVFLVGVQKEEADSITEVFKESNAQVAVMDLDMFSSADFMESIVDLSPSETLAFVDVGALGTRVSVRKNGQTIFMREFYIGGDAFTEAIAKSLGLSFEDAEALKIQDGTGIPQDAKDALRATLRSWKSELQQCEDIFVSQSDNDLIDQWFFFGGAYLTPGLKEVLYDDRFSSKVAELPLDEIFVSKGKNVNESELRHWASRLVTAAGLTTRKS